MPAPNELPLGHILFRRLRGPLVVLLLVFAPALYVLDEVSADCLRRYVENGGTLVVTTRSGVKDEANATVNAPLPGLLADVCGVEVEEYDALHPEVQVPLAWKKIVSVAGLPEVCASLWCDILTPPSAQVVARYQGEFYAQRAAITLNRFGQGQAAYVGSLGDSELHDAVTEWAVQIASVWPILATPSGVEAAERWRDGQRLLFLLNHADKTHEIRLSQPMTDLLSEQSVDGLITLAPKGVMVLRG